MIQPYGGAPMSTKQTILITGSSTGFGRLFAETLARKGHTVFATMRDPAGRNAKNAAEIRALAEKESLPIHIVELDVTNEASVEKAVSAAIQKAGRIDIAINNAGYPIVGLTEAITTEQAQKLMDTNFFGCVRVNRAVLPHMRKQRGGLLIHISSGAGRIVFPAFTHYCATKFAMEALAEGYRYELAGQGIDSVLIEPGAYETPIFGKIVTPGDPHRADTYGPAAKFAEKMNAALTGSAGNPQEVADLVLQVIETPAGQRNLRYRVSAGTVAIEEINNLSAKIQSQLLTAFGLAADTTFTQQKAAAQS
jgi:NAD(P)-dependent dehydrogenase (short-subunit alcohol dehydrogenase family)